MHQTQSDLVVNGVDLRAVRPALGVVDDFLGRFNDSLGESIDQRLPRAFEHRNGLREMIHGADRA